MYIVELQYFDKLGHFTGRDYTTCPGQDSDALISYIRGLNFRQLGNLRPAYICAIPEGGLPVIIKQEDRNDC